MVHISLTSLQYGRGFVFVPGAEEQYHLPPGQQTDHGPIYSVAMFHQMHCLGRIRKTYWVLRDGVATGDLSMARLLTGREGSHVHHCLDYLRQSIMCSGDMTLEWPMLTGPSAGITVDGWNIPHRCKSWVSGTRRRDLEQFLTKLRMEF